MKDEPDVKTEPQSPDYDQVEVDAEENREIKEEAEIKEEPMDEF